MLQSSFKISFNSVLRCLNSFLCHTDQESIPVPPSGAKSEMLKSSQNAPYQNWQAKEGGNFCKCKNIPSEHTAFNYFWTRSNVQGGSRRNSNCVSRVGSRKLQIAEHTMFQFQPQWLRSLFLTGRGGCGAAGGWKPSRNCAMARAVLSVPLALRGRELCGMLRPQWDRVAGTVLQGTLSVEETRSSSSSPAAAAE